MHNFLHEDLKKNTEKLKNILSSCSTRSIVSICATMFYFEGDPNKDEVKLSAKLKQTFFLLGLMLTTQEPKKQKDFSREDWHKAQGLLQDIFYSYSFMFFPTKDEVGKVSEEWKKVRDVAMPAFLHYFTSGVLASVEQVSQRILQYLSPFDDYLFTSIGINATDSLGISRWISSKLQYQVDELMESFAGMQQLHADFIQYVDGKIEDEDIDGDLIRKRYQTPEAISIVSNLHKSLNQLFHISIEDIKEVFGDKKADSFWNNYVSKRGEAKDYFYLTESNIVEERPLIEISDGLSVCPLSNSLYNAVEKVCSKALLEGRQKENFLKRRDVVLENEVQESFLNFFTNDVQIFSTVFETPQASYEHDLILLWNKKLLVIEAKATPPSEPFRDPEKAYERIKRSFRSNTGIQKAFDQAERIRKNIAIGIQVPLYDKKGNLVFTLDPKYIEEQYSVCVTRDNFGAIATNLSLLLNKSDNDPYPWAVNIYDLVNLLDAWKYLGWKPDSLFDFIQQRIKLNGKAFAFDELELAGFYIRHDSLQKITNADQDVIILNHTYSDVFDEIYTAQHTGEQFIREVIDEPFFQDMREILEPIKPKELSKVKLGVKKKQSRNDRCLCGSGKKYKHCCGT